MAREVVPVSQLGRRVTEQGRIRLGKKVAGGRGQRPTSIDTFRFTSPDKTAIEQLAAQYGGKVTACEDRNLKGQWEVETLVNEIGVILPPEALGGTPIYEQWSGGGLVVRCDGITASTPRKLGDGEWDFDESACKCLTSGKNECKVKVRLSVILRDIRFGGSWLLTTSSWNAAHELPGMIDMIEAVQDQGLTPALLRLVRRNETRFGETRTFVVPTLAIDASVNQILAGGNELSAPSSGGERAALPPASGPAFDPDDEVAEGVIEPEWDYEAVSTMAADVAGIWNTEHATNTVTPLKLLTMLAEQLTGIQGVSVKELDTAQAGKLTEMLANVLDGSIEITAIAGGRVKVRKQ